MMKTTKFERFFICVKKFYFLIPDNKKSLFKEFIISRNRNVTKKGKKNILKYNDHSIKIQHILNVIIKEIS